MAIRACMIAVGAAALTLLVVPAASATTFCVPSFHAGCPNNGSNVAQSSLQTAMNTSGDDTAPDRIVIAPGTITHDSNYTIGSGDEDDLEIIGAGPGVTNITSTASGNIFLMNLNGPRDITMRDLTLVIPASFNDNQGGALQTEQDTFENVDIESRNVRSDGANSMIGGSTFRDGRIYGAMGGSIDVGFSGNGAETGEMLIERTTIESPSWGINSDDPQVVANVRRVRIIDPLAYGLRTTNGAFMSVHNSIIEQADTGYPLIAESTSSGPVIVNARHLTISGVPDDPNDPAIKARVQNSAGNGLINMVVTDTIVDGYDNPLWVEAPVSGTIGDAGLTINYSYFKHSANVIGDANIANAFTIDTFSAGPPPFAGVGDFHLPANSPAIDAGTPATASLPTTDYDGTPRPLDGDGDGVAVRDMGAYEYEIPGPPTSGTSPPASGPGSPGAGPEADKVRPVLSKLRFSRKGRRVEFTLSERASVKLTFKQRSRKGKKRTKAVNLTLSGKQGSNRFSLPKRRLKAGKFDASATATDTAGNRSVVVKRKLTIKRK